MTDRAKIVFAASFVVCFVSYSFWNVIKTHYGIKIFYPGIALGFVGYTYVIKSLLKSNRQKNKKWLVFADIVHYTAISSLADEILFDPKVISVNEYMGFALIIFIAIYNYKKNERNDTTGKKGIL